MTITTEKLIELISNKADLEKEEVRSKVESLIETIRQETNNQGKYHIEGLGAFKKMEGELVFEPSENLSAEINNKYSGMQPIEIMEANQKSALRKTKASPEESVEEDRPVTQETSKQTKEKTAQTKAGTGSSTQNEPAEADKTDKKTQKETAKSKKSPATTSSQKDVGDSGTSEKKKKEKSAEAAGAGTAASSSKTSKSSKSPKSRDETSTGKTKKGEKETGRPFKQVGTTGKSNINRTSVQQKSKNDSVMDLVRTAGAIVLIALTVYFVYLLMGNIKPGANNGSDNGPDQAQVTQSMDSGNGAVSSKEKNNEDRSSSSQKTSQKSKKTKSQSFESSKVDKVNQEIESSELTSDFAYSEISTAAYGLRGQPSQLGMKGYTVVIYSFSKESNARKIKKTLLNKGFRVIINKVTVNNEEVWRVGIGQFPTIRRAQDAAKQLPKPYNTKHFLKRINN